MNLLADLSDFLRDHRPHGSLAGDATEPAWNGYLLTVACPCGVTFERWVTAEDAEWTCRTRRTNVTGRHGLSYSPRVASV